MTQLFIKTTGVKGGTSSTPKQTGEVTVREWQDGAMTAEITVDCFTGSGASYKRRDAALINIQLTSGKIWSGTFEDLTKALTK